MPKKKVRPKFKSWCWTCGEIIEGKPIKKYDKEFCSEECVNLYLD